MVDGHTLGDLVVAAGDEVIASGFLERADEPGDWRLWATDPWHAEGVRRLANGSVQVRLRAGAHPQPGAVSVRGTWSEASIGDAIVEPVQSLPATPWRSAGETPPGVLGAQGYREFHDAVQASVGGRIIASGGTDSALWFHVLIITPELAELHETFPTRVDLLAAVVPASLAR